MLIVSSMNHGIANMTCLMMSYCVILFNSSMPNSVKLQRFDMCH
ncbi:hypothetical protein AHYW_003716 [Providencia manganoxydans]